MPLFKALPTGTIVGDTDTQTLTNKTVNGVTLDNLAWTSYTPVATATTGTITTVGTTVGSYKQIGKTVHFKIKIPITTIGSAAGRMIVTLPVNCVLVPPAGFGSGYNDSGAAATGVVQYDVNNTVSITKTVLAVFPCTSGETLYFGGTYEAS